MNRPASAAKVLPPIDRQTRQLVLLLEQAVMRFDRCPTQGRVDGRQHATAQVLGWMDR